MKTMNCLSKRFIPAKDSLMINALIAILLTLALHSSAQVREADVYRRADPQVVRQDTLRRAVNPDVYRQVELQQVPQDEARIRTVNYRDLKPYAREQLQEQVNTDEPVSIMVREGNQFREVRQPISEFKFEPGVNMAVVKGTEVRNFESQGLYQIQNQMVPMQGWALNEVYLCRVEGETAPAVLKILVDTLGMLFYSKDARDFEGSINITLLEDSPGILQSKKLVEPVLVEFTSGSGTTVTPQQTIIGHTNLPSTSVSIRDRSAQNLVPVNIKTVFNPAGYLKMLHKESVLSIETPPRSLQGLGVQTIPVRIQVVGASAPVNVTVVSDKGTIEPDNVDVQPDRGATVMLRSEGTGTATVTVSATGFVSQSRDFNYVFPWRFMLFSFVGGFLGALVNFLMKKGKKNFRKMVLLGLITGFVVAILYYVLGIQLFSFKLSQTINEFAVLGLGFLGALLWDSIYALLSKSPSKNPT